MVFDIKRIFSGFFLLIFLSIIFFFKLNLLLIFVLIFLSFYDLIFSKIITLKNLIVFIILILISFFLFQIFAFHPIILSIFFALFFILSILKINNNFFIVTTICLFFYILIYLNRIDEDFIFILIFLSFLNDTCAYLVGKTIRGPLITPKISPNKTWSGTISSFLISYIVLYFFNFNSFVCFIIASSLFFGDLYFSYIKRKYFIKDFSNIIPGHGGILDRIDSIFFSSVILFTIKSL